MVVTDLLPDQAGARITVLSGTRVGKCLRFVSRPNLTHASRSRSDACEGKRVAPSLHPLTTLRLDLGGSETVGPVPFGMRQIVPIIGGQMAGERLTGTVRAGGADWVLAAPDGYGRLDGRVTIETSDGVLIAVTYMGLLELSDRAMQALTAGPPTEFGEITSLSYPRFETADARYSWLNTTFCVAEGRVLPTPAIEYALYEVHPSAT